MSIAFLIAAALAAAPATTPKPAAAPASASAAAPAQPVNLVPAFIGACMNPGLDVAKIREASIKAGGVAAPDQAGKDASDPTRMSGFTFTRGTLTYSVIFNRAGSCTVVAKEADIEGTKSALAQFVAGSTSVFDVNIPNDPKRAAGESVISNYVLTSKKGGPGLTITLSSVSRPGQGSATFLGRRVFTK